MKVYRFLKSKLSNADFVTNLLVILMMLYAGLYSLNAQCTAPGDPTAYSTNSWTGYVYSGLDTNNPPQNIFTGQTYRGYVTQTETFNQDLGAGSISGANVCGSYADSFSIRFRMQKTFTAGYYSVTVGGDDGYRLSTDGGATWTTINNWNYHSYQTTTATLYLSGTLNLVLEYYDQGGLSQVSFSTVFCGPASSAPTGISGTTAICNGSSTTLTATGGTLATGAVYQWGTGNTVGNNVIAGQTAESITVSPTANTTYWVRRVDAAPCSVPTTGITQVVTVQNPSTAPTTISGTTTLCLGASTTLTASGGTTVAGTTYEWGTGSTVGSNVISGQTTASITVTPSANTTYWVRKVSPTPCGATSGITVDVTVNVPPGDQSSYGNNAWIGYVYATIGTANPPADAFTVPYKGYITEPETFDQNWGSGSVSGPNVCGSYDTRFAVKFKMQKNFTPGYYTFTVGGDDGYRLSLDGGSTYTINNWNDHGYTTTNSAQLFLSGNVNLVLDFYEQGGDARVSFSYVSCTDYSTAPTSITGTTTICRNTSTVLTATGGYAAASATYQWGTGTTVGSNVIGGQTSSSITVNPGTNSTTYWVRRLDPAPCNLTTGGVTQLVTVIAPSTNPTGINATSTNICLGSSTTITVTGGTNATGMVYEWGTGTTGSNVIAGETGASITVTPSATTGYWVRKVDPAPCNTASTPQTITINVATPSTAPTSINNATSVCAPVGGITLNAIGGTAATGSTYQWGTGTVAGSNVSGGNGSTYTANPSVITTYWVRRRDAAPCSTYSDAVFATVYPSSTAPTNISGTNLICAGSSTTLTASGGRLAVNAAYEWGTGTTGSNVIAGETAASIVVSPTVTTTYWVRRVDPTPCSASTGAMTYTVTVNQPSVAPTSITGAPASGVCTGSSYTLTATGGSGSNTFQWGTGATPGSNVITGQTGSSITVSPTSTTTYWVRRVESAPCTGYSSSATATITVTAPGDPTVFGTNQWNVYGYTTADINLISGGYAGYYTQTTLNFDTQASWNNSLSPSAASNWNGCSIQNDNFTFVHKRRGFPCGNYTVRMTNWDDAAQVWIDGVLRWTDSNWSGAGGSGLVGNFNLTNTSTIEVRTRENGGGANAAISLTYNTVAPTAPTSISGTTLLCDNTSTTLTAVGGANGTNGTFEWGTGSTVGSNVITGQNASTLNVSPSATTTYWVRRIDPVCGNNTSGVSQTVSVAPATVAGTVSGTTTTVCQNTAPSDLHLTGQSGNVVKWQYANDAAFTSGVTDIVNTSTTLSSEQIGNLSATRYFRAVVQNGTCPAKNSAAIAITVPTAVSYTNGAWSGTPSATTPVIINSNLAISSDLNVCSCRVKANVTVTVASNKNLIVQKDLVVEPTGQLIFEDKASLVQVDDASTDTGSIKFKRNTQRMKTYDYTYWSAPVQNTTLAQLSPLTLTDKYYRFDPSINNWVSIAGGAGVMEAGRGYIVRAPQGWTATNASNGVYSAEFNGVPNNGIVSATIQKGAGTFNLIGNPYPSAIDIDKFLTDSANAGIITGTIYLWTHNTAISSTIPGDWLYNYTADDYAKYNLTGGVRTANPAITGGSAPDGKVAAGQGFFIEANAALANGNYVATFRNSMRVVGHNDVFYRPAPQQNDGQHSGTAATKNRLWLNITNANGAYNEILVGYLAGATNGFDNLYDGKVFPAGNNIALYSISGADQYAIQGRALPFMDSDVIPLGYKTTVANTFTIALDQFDGLFTGQDVYLIDHELGTTTNLKQGNYTFTSAVGTFDGRFEIHFTNGLLATHQSEWNENSVLVSSSLKMVGIRADRTIESIHVFDLLGRSLYTANKVNAKEHKTPGLTTAEQVVIIKIQLADGYETARKVILE